MKTIINDHLDFQHIYNYVEVLKPKETLLLLFIGISSFFISAEGYVFSTNLLIVFFSILCGCAGCNGITNYLDRNVDARCIRTQNRVLPSQRITPAEKVLPLIIFLIILSLTLAWIINPLCFYIGITGVIASIAWRKTVSCTFLGIVGGISPILVGWFAANQVFSVKIALIIVLVAAWIPIHVWSVMIAHREDYIRAGLGYFPLTVKVRTVMFILLFLAVFIIVVSLCLYLFNQFGVVYLVIAALINIILLISVINLMRSLASLAAWKLYKYSSFPYLGIFFISMILDKYLFTL